ncbi:hypothetical protein [Rahnella sp. PAMC 25559]|uniref:hypothetical protein n=1 Tax=Rahnella sp. PAMC 25559 TaxID=3423225 RepID=UPI003D66E726
MNKISKFVWIGLIINVLWLGILASIMLEAFNYLWFIIIPFFIAMTFQVVSVSVLFKTSRLGLALAILGSLIMLPFSMVFFIGYLFSYENICNNGLKTYKSIDNKKPESELNFNTSKLAMRGLLFVIIGLVFIGVFVGWLFLCLGLILILNSFRLKNTIMLGLLDNNIIVTPGMNAQTYLIPLSDVMLIKEDKKIVKLHILSAGVNRECSFRKSLIKNENNRSVLGDIISKLAAQDK